MTTAPKSDQPPASTTDGQFQRWTDVLPEVEWFGRRVKYSRVRSAS